MARLANLLGFCSLSLAAMGCEPASITEARNQLARGPARTVTFALPIADTALTAADFLSMQDTVTLPNGLMGLKFEADTIAVTVGEQLQFSNVNLDPFSVDFPAVVFAQPVGTMIDTTTSYNALASEARLQAVDSVVIDTGTLQITTSNRLPAPQNYSIVLLGVTDPSGTPLSQDGVLPAAPGDGTYVSQVLTFDLTGVTFDVAGVQAVLADSMILPATPINPALGTAALMQTGTANFTVRSLSGPLDPAATPELVVSGENAQEVQSSDIDFADFEDAVLQATINDATADLTITNTSGTPVLLSGATLGIVRLDPTTGLLQRDGSGNPIYETDGSGPLLLAIAVTRCPDSTAEGDV